MKNNCEKIIFSTRAYNAIIAETYGRIKTETGGILLGHIVEGVWYVIESIDPGPKSIFTPTYFEYDTEYVNNLSRAIATQYKKPLNLLGLWHRHPGSLDTFSSTDDGTNTVYAKLNPNGAISGLVNLDPDFRLTMYHVSYPLRYESIRTDAGNSLIPEELLQLKYAHVNFTQKQRVRENTKNEPIPKMQNTTREHNIKNNEVKENIAENGALNKILEIGKKFGKEILSIVFHKDDTVASTYQDIEPHSEQEVDEKLLDILTFEETLLEEQKYYNFESEVFDNRIAYSFKLKEPQKGFLEDFNFVFLFTNEKYILIFGKTRYEYQQGIFKRLLDSIIEQKKFNG